MQTKKTEVIKTLLIWFCTVFALIFLSAISNRAQDGEICGTHSEPGNNPPQLSFEKQQAFLRGKSTLHDIIIVPIAFHVVRMDDSSCDVADSQIVRQVEVLNAGFNSTRFKFILHSIDRINNSAWTTHRIRSAEEIAITFTGGQVCDYALFQNYPNPFNPSTTIKFGLPEKANLSLVIYNQLGQEVTTLLSEEREAGYHTVEWNATNYSSGIYLVEMRTEKFRSVKKLMMVK